MNWTKEQLDEVLNRSKTLRSLNQAERFLDKQILKTPNFKAVSILDAYYNMKILPTTDIQKLNKTEAAYWKYLQYIGEPWCGCQCITLKLADDTRYTPDFWALDTNGNIRALEVKGFFRDDAKVKIKVAARQFPWIKFVLVRKDGVSWNHEDVKP